MGSIKSVNDDKYDRHFQAISQFSDNVSKTLKVSVSELVFLLSFVANFFVGKLIHLTSQKEEVYNYYNNKRNVFNQIFVKRGWGWTTLIIVLFYSCLLYTSNHPKIQGKQQRIQVIKRGVVNYAIATVWWVLFTQWCFGLPIMDKVFVWTGGKCTSIDQGVLLRHNPSFGASGVFAQIEADLSYESSRITSYMCRRLKGSWEGGHDPSGHVFLLIHSSLYLFLEALPFWVSWKTLYQNLFLLVQKLRTGHANKPQLLLSFVLHSPHVLVLLLIGLWWFMLFMTNIYFHSIAEKLVGLVFGYLGIFVVYYCPRWL